MAPFKIAIIGAGPGGCTLARILMQNSSTSQITIFEGEASASQRSQGGTLDLQDSTGLKALREAGLYEEFLKNARFDGEALKIMDKKGVKYLSFGGAKDGGEGRGSPEIDREKLRDLLFESLPNGMVRWGRRLKSVDEALRLHFEQGVEEGFDLVVGADGAWSKVRSRVTDQKPLYSGISGYSCYIHNAKDHPDLDKLVNRGSVFAASDGKQLTGQQMGDGSLHTSAWMVGSEIERGLQGPVSDGLAVKEKLRKDFHDWVPELLKLIEVADEDSFTLRSLYMLPVGNRWKNQPGVTLLGDAAHLMTPFAGVGVNTAMVDAVNLAHAILDAEKAGTKAALMEGVAHFEEGMFKEGKKMQEFTYGNMNDLLFTEGAPRTTIESWLVRGAEGKAGIDGWKLFLFSKLVYAYFYFFKLFH